MLQDIVENCSPPPGAVIRLYCTPKALEQLLVNKLPERFDLNPHHFTHVLMAVESHDGRIRWSVVPASLLYKQGTDDPKALPDCVAHVRV
jgi:hypothetical protein